MSENRKKVLELLAAGKLSVEEAERLLQKLTELHQAEVAPESAMSAESAAGGPTVPLPTPSAVPALQRIGTKHPRYLRVLVDSVKGDKVNVRVPMALIRTGIKLSALLPTEARVELEKNHIDLPSFAKMAPDEIVEALAELEVDVDSSSGDKVRVFCE